MVYPSLTEEAKQAIAGGQPIDRLEHDHADLVAKRGLRTSDGLSASVNREQVLWSITMFSRFCSAFRLLLFALIIRAVSLEFRSKVHNPFWRSVWDWAFFAASLAAALLFGVVGGNLIAGLAINEAGDWTGTMLDQLWSPTVGVYPLVVGALTVALFAMGTDHRPPEREARANANLSIVRHPKGKPSLRDHQFSGADGS